MLCRQLPVYGKFKFCFLKLSGIYFSNIFDPSLVESVVAETADREGWLYSALILVHTVNEGLNLAKLETANCLVTAI